MNRHTFRSVPARKRGPIAVLAAAVAAAVSLAVAGYAGSAASAAPVARAQGTGSATGLGQLSGLLPRDHLTEESALQVDLSNETVRLPLYPGPRMRARRTPRRSGTSCWTPPTPGWRTTWA